MTVTQARTTPLIIPIDGQLVHSNRNGFKQRVLDAIAEGEKRIVIDCTGTKYIDSAGLGVLFSLNKAAIRNGGRFILAGLNADMLVLFEMTKLNAVMTIAETVGGAIAKLGGAQG